MAMLAMNKFVTLVEVDFFNTTKSPNELPSKAMIKITAYAQVIPILNSSETSKPCETGLVVVAAKGNKNCLNSYCNNSVKVYSGTAELEGGGL